MREFAISIERSLNMFKEKGNCGLLVNPEPAHGMQDKPDGRLQNRSCSEVYSLSFIVSFIVPIYKGGVRSITCFSSTSMLVIT